MTGMDNGS